MKNSLLIKFKSRVKINVQGKNVERFIKRLKNNNIELLKINYVKYNEINIIIYKKDYEKVMDIKSIYDITEKDIYGIIKVNKFLLSYRFIIAFMILSLALLIFLSKIVFNIEVIHTDSKFRQFLINELEEHGIKKYKFKKSFNEIQQIKEAILTEYKDSLEWLEIENNGTTYIVRVQERIIPDTTTHYDKQHVVAKKSAIIKRIVADKGVIIREIDEYVNKGDIIISGNVYLYDNIKDVIRAEGKVYGEVWYNVTVEYPYIYAEMKETGNEKDVYTLNILNKTFEFTNEHYLEKKFEETKILWHPLLPISFAKQHQKEVTTISEVLTIEEATKKAIVEAQKKMLESLDKDASIIDYHILSSDIKDDKVVLNVFFSVSENITAYEKIEEIPNVP